MMTPTVATKPARKQTSGNNPVLARIKDGFNPKIYASARKAWDLGGREAAMETMGAFYREEIRAERIAELFRD